MSLRFLKLFIIIMILGLFMPAIVYSQQSTTGPEPPPGLERNQREPTRTQVILSVPAYLWHNGCGPTAAGMVVGYWAAQGYDDLVDGTDYWTMSAGVEAMIASDNGYPSCGSGPDDHVRDYSCPKDYSPNPIQKDKSELGGAHTNNCVADFMETSWSSEDNYYGWSWFSDVDNAFREYVEYKTSYEFESTNYRFYMFSWERFKDEIDAGRPVVLLVDTDGNNNTDHFITAVGYDDATMEYACQDTWDTDIYWYDFSEIAPYNDWGIYGFTTFGPCPDSDEDGFGDPGTFGLICPPDNCPDQFNPEQLDADNDSVGDVCDNCIDIYNPDQADGDGDDIGDACEFICGDSNGDGNVNVSDAVKIINYVFVGGTPPDPMESGDCNCDQTCNISDAVAIINYIFVGGYEPCDPSGDGVPDC